MVLPAPVVDMLLPPKIFNAPKAGIALPESETNDVGRVPPVSRFIVPAPRVMAIVPPADARLAATGSAPVLPINNCPFVNGPISVTAAVPDPTIIVWSVIDVTPVPPPAIVKAEKSKLPTPTVTQS